MASLEYSYELGRPIVMPQIDKYVTKSNKEFANSSFI